MTNFFSKIVRRKDCIKRETNRVTVFVLDNDGTIKHKLLYGNN